MSETQQNNYYFEAFVEESREFNHPTPTLPVRGGKKAFTLAEVLITLVIIGVIAAITVPTIINNIKNREIVERLKKTYAVLQNAASIISDKYGYPPGDYSIFDTKNFITEFAKHTNVAKACDTITECFDLNNHTYKTMHGYNFFGSPNFKSIITSDGQIYTFEKSSGGFGLSSTDQSNIIGVVTVDLNGHKKPNIVGYDVFLFVVVRNRGILPAGAFSTATCYKGSNGYGCCARVLKTGKIDY